MRPSRRHPGAHRRRLRRGYVAGRLGTDTFSRRVDDALRADHGTELRGLTADLPAPPPARWRLRWLRRARAACSPAAARPARLVLGRSSGCQLVFADDTVSRRHAELRLDDGRWMLRDLGSSNGTWVNGRRMSRPRCAPATCCSSAAAAAALARC